MSFYRGQSSNILTPACRGQIQSLYFSVGGSGLAHCGMQACRGIVGRAGGGMQADVLQVFSREPGNMRSSSQDSGFRQGTTTNSVNQSRKSHAHRVYIPSLFSSVVPAERLHLQVVRFLADASNSYECFELSTTLGTDILHALPGLRENMR